jgi:hypothetical protein
MIPHYKESINANEEVISVLMDEGYTWNDAVLAIKEMRDRIVDDKEDAYAVLSDFGLEPDYLMGII